MYEEEYLEYVRLKNKEYLKWLCENGSPATASTLYKNAIKKIKSRFSHDCGYSGRLTVAQQQEFEKLIARIDAPLRTQCDELILDMHKRNARISIHHSTAKALIIPLMEREGYAYHLELQKNAAKLSIRISKQKKATLYIHYNKEIYKRIDMIPETIATIKRMYEVFGSNSGITSIRWDDNFIEPSPNNTTE